MQGFLSNNWLTIICTAIGIVFGFFTGRGYQKARIKIKGDGNISVQNSNETQIRKN